MWRCFWGSGTPHSTPDVVRSSPIDVDHATTRTTNCTMTYHQQEEIPIVIAAGDRSKHCRSVARSPNSNRSYDQTIVRSGVTVAYALAASFLDIVFKTPACFCVDNTQVLQFDIHGIRELCPNVSVPKFRTIDLRRELFSVHGCTSSPANLWSSQICQLRFHFRHHCVAPKRQSLIDYRSGLQSFSSEHACVRNRRTEHTLGETSSTIDLRR